MKRKLLRFINRIVIIAAAEGILFVAALYTYNEISNENAIVTFALMLTILVYSIYVEIERR